METRSYFLHVHVGGRRHVVSRLLGLARVVHWRHHGESRVLRNDKVIEKSVDKQQHGVENCQPKVTHRQRPDRDTATTSLIATLVPRGDTCTNCRQYYTSFNLQD